MAVIRLESLVLRGSAVLQDGNAGNLRLGTSYAAGRETPEIRISMRHPSPGCVQEFQPATWPDHADDLRMDSRAAYGAGRSRSRAGVLSSSRLRRTADSAATVLAGVTPAVMPVVKRCPAGLAWCKPARMTPPASTWGFGVR